MFYTSYFAKISKIPKDFAIISICAKTPAWYHGVEYKKLAPTYDILMTWKRDHNNEAYVERFSHTIIGKLSIKTVINDLNYLANGNENIVLLCYEKPENFCHRHLVAKWLCDNGYPCREL